MVKRQRFTAEFKREAVRLLDAGEKPASEGSYGKTSLLPRSKRPVSCAVRTTALICSTQMSVSTR
jgi:transposase